MQDIYTPFIIIICLICSATLKAQQFEYVLTQQELAGARINTIELFDDKIYLGGGTKDEGNPLIVVFDTSGNLVNYKTFLPEKPDLWYGEITHIRYDQDQEVLVVNASVAPACDVGSPSVFSWQINTNLDRIDEFEFSIPGITNLYHPNIRHSDTLITITAEGAAAIYDQRNTIYRQLQLPSNLSNPVAIIHQNRLIVFDNYQKNSLQSIDMDGTILISEEVNPFRKIELVAGLLITSGTDGKIRVYDAVTFQMQDSLVEDGFTDVEFSILNTQLMEIAFHQKQVSTKVGIYDLNLNLVQDIGDFPNETRIAATIDNSQNLYQMSSHYLTNIDDPRNKGLIPVLRKINLSTEWSPSVPELEITEVAISNPSLFSSCREDEQIGICDYSSSQFEHLYYSFTVQNNGQETINNLGHYVGTVAPTYCGNLYQDYRYYQDLSLAPGESLTISDSTHLYWVANAPSLNFYAVGPNHRLSNPAGSVYTAEDISTSIFQSSRHEILSIFPNPVSDFLTIEHPTGPTSIIQIYSVTGRRLNQFKKDTNQIDIRPLSPGLYFIRLQEDKKTYLASFVKTE